MTLRVQVLSALRHLHAEVSMRASSSTVAGVVLYSGGEQDEERRKERVELTLDGQEGSFFWAGWAPGFLKIED
jgi:hypothetical protein